ncbi:MAG: GxxExxY protein [Bacteroidetes bacterium]|nr:GxxExxY protein [Bacteroidota bacterium]
MNTDAHGLELNDVTYKIIGCMYRVHSALGPGLLESTYEVCLLHELAKNGLKVERQKALPIVYDGIKLDAAYRIDLLVEDRVIIELKVVDVIANIHKAQVLSYLKLSKCEVGLLINFNVTDMKKGITRLKA